MSGLRHIFTLVFPLLLSCLSGFGTILSARQARRIAFGLFLRAFLKQL
jgi:hypothetical protein